MQFKFIKSILLVPVLLSTGLVQISCMGSFKLTKMVYNWNDHATGNKIINNVLFWILGSVQAYSFSLFLDCFIFNFVEFWTGNNPLAMKKGEVKEHFVMSQKGEILRFRATQNQIEVFKNSESTFKLRFSPESKNWTASEAGKSVIIAKQISESEMGFYKPDGTLEIFSMAQLAKLSSLEKLKSNIKNGQPSIM